MTDTANLGLPCIEGSQAQKHVTHNDALRILDTLVQLAVLDRDLSAPPSSPTEGQRWIVKTAGTGAWSGHNNAIAAWQDGSWQFSVPQTGWIAFVADEGTLLAWNGTAWGDFFSTVTSIQNLALLGIGTAADTTNILNAKLNNALFAARTVAEGGDGALRYKLSKESAAKTLSFLFQDNFSGRAEVGLTGDDDFHFKVSPDGTSWFEGLKIAAATGRVSFPASGGPREMLSVSRIYYVRADGSDSNTGLSNSSSAALLTIQKAYDTITSSLDLGGQTVTIQIGDGTYTGGLSVSQPWTGGGAVTLAGNNASPGNVIISTTSKDAIGVSAALPGTLLVKDLELQTTTSGNCINHAAPGTLNFQNLQFGACAGSHIAAGAGGAKVAATGNYTINGSAAQSHMICGGTGALILVEGKTVTLSGTLTFATFAFASTLSGILADGNTWSGGTITGQRYNAQLNGVLYTAAAGANYFPGSTAGATATGGQYL
jgi:hypothetical protein